MARSILQAAAESLGPEKLAAQFSPEEWLGLQHQWRVQARPEQIAPPGDWRVFLIRAGRGFGKMLDLQTPIPTPSGWSTMGALRAGDEVFDEAGRVCHVLAAHAPQTPAKAYRLWFSDGTHLDAGEEHQWVTWRHADRKALLRSRFDKRGCLPDDWTRWRAKNLVGWSSALPRDVVESAIALSRSGVAEREIARQLGHCRQAIARHIKNGQFVEPIPHESPEALGPRVRTTAEIVTTLTYNGRGDANHSIPVCRPLQLHPIELPIDPYVLGVWLGDGNSASATLTTADAEILDLLRARRCIAGPAKTNERSAAARYSLGAKPPRRGSDGRMIDNGSLHSALRLLGVLNNKHVPPMYLRASEQQRVDLLQGLMDTDGYARPTGSVVEFCSTKECLAHAVMELARSVGQKPVLAAGRATLYGRDIGPKYRVCWRPTIPVFALPRKAAALRTSGPQYHRNLHRMIVRAEEIPAVPMRCITVDSRNSMYLAGEAMIPTHNSRAGAEFVREEVEAGRARSVALVAPTAADARDTMVESPYSGLLVISRPDFRPSYEPSKRRLTWPNGARATLFSAEEPERLRGPQHDCFWADELAAWDRCQATWDMLQFGLRVGLARGVVTTTPRPIPTLAAIRASARTVEATGSTYDNAANLDPSFFAAIREQYEGTRLGRQEIHAEILDDNPHALWKLAQIDACRVSHAPDLKRVVVAVDPAVSHEETSDETGIVVCGVGMCRCKGEPELHGFVLDDASGIYTAAEWGAAVVRLYDMREADRVVAEVNQGGDLVEANIRSAPGGAHLAYRGVHAKKGKYLRAEPIAGLFEQKKIHMAGTFAKLEDQLTQWDPVSEKRSPDRLDAMVYALTELMLGSAAPGFTGPRRPTLSLRR